MKKQEVTGPVEVLAASARAILEREKKEKENPQYLRELRRDAKPVPALPPREER